MSSAELNRRRLTNSDPSKRTHRPGRTNRWDTAIQPTTTTTPAPTPVQPAAPAELNRRRLTNSDPSNRTPRQGRTNRWDTAIQSPAPITTTSTPTPVQPAAPITVPETGGAAGGIEPLRTGGVKPTSTQGTDATKKNKKKPINTTHNPSTRNVSPLASDQLNQILSNESPLMTQAATTGMQYASSRGLLNSSLGAEASQGAMIAAAAPIAMANADYASNKVLQNDRLSVQIMQSDMPTKQKNAALDFILGGNSRLKVKDPKLSAKNYKEVQSQYGDFQSFIMDSKARDSFRMTDKERKEKYGVMNPLTGKLTFTDQTIDIMKSIGGNMISSSDRAKVKAIVDIYGSWEGAMKAARMWGGKNLSDNEAKELILSTLK